MSTAAVGTPVGVLVVPGESGSASVVDVVVEVEVEIVVVLVVLVVAVESCARAA